MTNDNVMLYNKLHADERYYGESSIGWLPLIHHYILDLNPKSILDYGCGKSTLMERISGHNISKYRFDPAIPELSIMPNEKVDMILCIDVLEHIPENELDDTLFKIRSLSANVFFNISCVSSSTKLPDGSNAHCTVHAADWWQMRLKKHFDIVENVYKSKKRAIIITWRASSHYNFHDGFVGKFRRGFINLLCCFIPRRKWRQYIRSKLRK
jgi:hypothetical protein